jgi:hypothetical protein
LLAATFHDGIALLAEGGVRLCSNPVDICPPPRRAKSNLLRWWDWSTSSIDSRLLEVNRKGAFHLLFVPPSTSLHRERGAPIKATPHS